MAAHQAGVYSWAGADSQADDSISAQSFRESLPAPVCVHQQPFRSPKVIQIISRELMQVIDASLAGFCLLNQSHMKKLGMAYSCKTGPDFDHTPPGVKRESFSFTASDEHHQHKQEPFSFTINCA
jgi:hypothetical protein